MAKRGPITRWSERTTMVFRWLVLCLAGCLVALAREGAEQGTALC